MESEAQMARAAPTGPSASDGLVDDSVFNRRGPMRIISEAVEALRPVQSSILEAVAQQQRALLDGITAQNMDSNGPNDGNNESDSVPAAESERNEPSPAAFLQSRDNFARELLVRTQQLGKELMQAATDNLNCLSTRIESTVLKGVLEQTAFIEDAATVIHTENAHTLVRRAQLQLQEHEAMEQLLAKQLQTATKIANGSQLAIYSSLLHSGYIKRVAQQQRQIQSLSAMLAGEQAITAQYDNNMVYFYQIMKLLTERCDYYYHLLVAHINSGASGARRQVPNGLKNYNFDNYNKIKRLTLMLEKRLGLKGVVEAIVLGREEERSGAETLPGDDVCQANADSFADDQSSPADGDGPTGRASSVDSVTAEAAQKLFEKIRSLKQLPPVPFLGEAAQRSGDKDRISSELEALAFLTRNNSSLAPLVDDWLRQKDDIAHLQGENEEFRHRNSKLLRQLDVCTTALKTLTERQKVDDRWGLSRSLDRAGLFSYKMYPCRQGPGEANAVHSSSAAAEITDLHNALNRSKNDILSVRVQLEDANRLIQQLKQRISELEQRDEPNILRRLNQSSLRFHEDIVQLMASKEQHHLRTIDALKARIISLEETAGALREAAGYRSQPDNSSEGDESAFPVWSSGPSVEASEFKPNNGQDEAPQAPGINSSVRPSMYAGGPSTESIKMLAKAYERYLDWSKQLEEARLKLSKLEHEKSSSLTTLSQVGEASAAGPVGSLLPIAVDPGHTISIFTSMIQEVYNKILAMPTQQLSKLSASGEGADGHRADQGNAAGTLFDRVMVPAVEALVATILQHARDTDQLQHFCLEHIRQDNHHHTLLMKQLAANVRQIDEYRVRAEKAEQVLSRNLNSVTERVLQRDPSTAAVIVENGHGSLTHSRLFSRDIDFETPDDQPHSTEIDVDNETDAAAVALRNERIHALSARCRTAEDALSEAEKINYNNKHRIAQLEALIDRQAQQMASLKDSNEKLEREVLSIKRIRIGFNNIAELGGWDSSEQHGEGNGDPNDHGSNEDGNNVDEGDMRVDNQPAGAAADLGDLSELFAKLIALRDDIGALLEQASEVRNEQRRKCASGWGIGGDGQQDAEGSDEGEPDGAASHVASPPSVADTMASTEEKLRQAVLSVLERLRRAANINTHIAPPPAGASPAAGSGSTGGGVASHSNNDGSTAPLSQQASSYAKEYEAFIDMKRQRDEAMAEATRLRHWLEAEQKRNCELQRQYYDVVKKDNNKSSNGAVVNSRCSQDSSEEAGGILGEYVGP